MIFKIGDKIRDKASGAEGIIIQVSEFVNMYRIDCGDRCVWVLAEDAEQV